MILLVCLNPTLQKTLLLPVLRPGEVNRSARRFLDASGKGVNAARILGQLGREAVLLSHAGGRDRDLFLGMAAADGVRVEGPDSASEIRYCLTLLDEKNKTTTEIVEESEPVGPGTEALVRRGYERLLSLCGLVVISGTRAPGYGADLYSDFTRMAKERGRRVILDLRGEDLLRSLEHGPDVVKPNFAEFAATFVTDGRMGGETDADPDLARRVEEAAAGLSRGAGPAVVLTRGSLPALCALGGEVFHSPPETLAPVNTIGCGDAFAAGFASAWEASGLIAPGDAAFPAVFRLAVGEGHRAAALNAVNPRPGRIR